METFRISWHAGKSALYIFVAVVCFLQPSFVSFVLGLGFSALALDGLGDGLTVIGKMLADGMKP